MEKLVGNTKVANGKANVNGTKCQALGNIHLLHQGNVRKFWLAHTAANSRWNYRIWLCGFYPAALKNDSGAFPSSCSTRPCSSQFCQASKKRPSLKRIKLMPVTSKGLPVPVCFAVEDHLTQTMSPSEIISCGLTWMSVSCDRTLGARRMAYSLNNLGCDFGRFFARAEGIRARAGRARHERVSNSL